MKIFDPTTPPAARPIALAPRPVAPHGLRVGLIENTKFNADTLLQKIAARLGSQYGMTVGHMARKRSPSHEVDEAAIAELARRADFVVSGIGD
jgi:hypothetical protein